MPAQDTHPVSYNVENTIAVLTMNNAPVNALSQKVRLGLLEGVQKATDDQSITAIVITSSLPLFSGGADISEFAGGNLEPALPDVLDVIEQSAKPVVAALPGPAFGGGLELALACHARVTVTGNKVGLPEVNLGILPGAGGTQRLPRLISPVLAAQMIVSGKPEPVKKLTGLFDVLADDTEALKREAIKLAKSLAPERVKRTCDIQLEKTPELDAALAELKATVAKQSKGFFAPLKCVEAVEAALNLPFSEGLKKEGELFMACMNTPQARAQQHFFFAERAAAHVSDFDRNTPVRAIKQVAIIGAGTMGGGIAMNFATAGIPVVMLEREQAALDKGLAVIRRNYENSAKKGKLTEQDVETRMNLLKGTTDFSALSDADLVIEAVFEKLDVKQAVFRQLDEVCKSGAILATNTSTLDVNAIAGVTSRPQDVIGLHFFSPANVMKLLEVVKADQTSPEVIKTCMQMAKKINKVAVLVGVCFGFVGNRMIEPYGREANRLVLEGVEPWRIDKVLTDFGMPMGPFTMGDMAGLDIGYYVRQSRKEAISHDPSYGVVADRLVEQGRHGLKTGAGVYQYAEGSRKPEPDPEVMAIAKEEAQRLGVTQRSDVSDDEILVRVLYTLINEGADILHENIADKASDIDVIYVYGYGFPVYRGGPMHFADEVGVKHIYDKLCHYRDALGEYGKTWLQPGELLTRLANENGKFSQYQQS